MGVFHLIHMTHINSQSDMSMIKVLISSLLMVLTFKEVASVNCVLKSDIPHYKKYCCECWEKDFLGGCKLLQSEVCKGASYQSDPYLSCPRGYWGCYRYTP